MAVRLGTPQRLPHAAAPCMSSLYARKTALITGASSGIGLELARLCAADHHDVVLVARRRDRLLQLAQSLESEFSVKAEVIVEDLRHAEAAPRIIDELERRNLSIDVLVNDAGFGNLGAFVNTDVSIALDMMALNMRALVHLTHRLLPTMLARGTGRILNVGSMAGFLPGPDMAVYYATKAFVNSFSEALAVELRGTGVSVTLCCPGPTATEFGVIAGSDARRLTAARSMPAARVARHAYRAMQQQQVVAIPGASNLLIVQMLRCMPRALARRLTGMINRTARGK